MPSLEASLIIAFYNKLDYLKLVLASLERQSSTNFEIMIADDGSREEVVRQLQEIIQHSTLRIRHVWHEDQGWRKNEIMNKAVVMAQTDYLIVIDGDCVCHPRFVEEHLRHRQQKICLTGRRVNLSPKITDRLTAEKVSAGFLEKNQWLLIKDGLLGNSTDVERGVYFQASWLSRLFNRKERGLLGCNYSIYKHDLLTINGFDERYRSAAWGEDTDVQFRLELVGIRIKTLLNVAVQYHLYHKTLDRPVEGQRIFEQVKSEKIAFTPYGIQQPG